MAKPLFATPLPPTHALLPLGQKQICRYCGAALGSFYWSSPCFGYMS